MDPKHSQGPDRADYQEGPDDLTEVHAAIQREHPEPTTESTPVPMWLIGICGGAICWAGLYLGFFNGGFKGDVFNELNTTASLMFPAPIKGGAAAAKAEPTLAEQGKAVYATCAACHTPTGVGQPGVIPPLAKSQYVVGSEKRLAAIILKGMVGPVTVNGATFNSQMQAWEGSFSDKKIAAVASYIRTSFGNTAGPVNEKQIAAARAEFKDHAGQMTEADVLKIPEDAKLPGGEDAAGGTANPADAVANPAPAAPNPAGGTPNPAPAAAGPASGTPNPSPAVAGPAGGTPSSSPAVAGPASGAATPEQIAAGKATYATICIACHLPTGTGMPSVFPPLTKSPYVAGSAERLVAIILKGNIGPFVVDGKPYNNVMPPQESTLTDTKIADVATYVRNAFGNTASPVTADQVKAARAKFTSRATPWTQPELDAWKE